MFAVNALINLLNIFFHDVLKQNKAKCELKVMKKWDTTIISYRQVKTETSKLTGCSI